MKVRLYACGGEKPLSEYPLGLGYLKTNIEGADVQIVKDKYDLIGGDVIGLSTNAWGVKEAFDIATKIALNISPNPIVVIGGQGALWPKWEEMDIFDHIVRGSGELAMQQIIDGRAESKVMRVPLGEIDSLQFPDRGHCDKVIPCVTSRGCPYGCTFCSSKAHWGRPQYHSAAYVIRDVISALERYPHAKEVRFMDDLYITPFKRFEALHGLWMSHGLNKRVVPHGFVRADLLDAKTLRMLREMGVDRIRFGVESGSPRMLKLIGKGITVEQFQQAIDLTHAAGLPCAGSFVAGLPGETEEDRRLTAEFKRRNQGKLIDGGSYTFKPFPGCGLYNGEDPRIFDMRVRPI